jgi:ubiquinone/menaquinone biosynthesis C-methylase UbiE
MTNFEAAVAQHYGRGGLLERILAGLEAAGIDPGALRPEDLSPVDEFHIGGRQATKMVLDRLAPGEGRHILDAGCGIGGAARYLAAETGCRVTGIDLTSEYVETAKALTQLTGQAGKVGFETASALDLPFDDAAFDGAITIHVAMNIPDRAALYDEIARVLKPGAVFCLYDVMKKGDEALAYPVPWAESPETSHLEKVEDMPALLEVAGFEIMETEDLSEFGLEFMRQRLVAMAGSSDGGPPPLGVHLIMGGSAPAKFRNMLDNLENGRVAPVLMKARRK